MSDEELLNELGGKTGAALIPLNTAPGTKVYLKKRTGRECSATLEYLGKGYIDFVFRGRVIESDSPFHHVGVESNDWCRDEFEVRA